MFLRTVDYSGIEVSLSKEERLRNIELALKLMLRDLGQNGIDGCLFELRSEVFKDVESTTWRQLQEMFLIERMDTMGNPACRLTGAGWRVALDMVWEDNKQVLQDALSKLAAALKDAVKGREEDAFVSLHSVASTCGLPENWVYNAIESRLLEHKFNMKGAYWYENRPPLIRVPLDFGLEPL